VSAPYGHLDALDQAPPPPEPGRSAGVSAGWWETGAGPQPVVERSCLEWPELSLHAYQRVIGSRDQW